MQAQTHTYAVGDVVRLKKSHPCGAQDWLVTRVGMDIGLKCTGCGHYVMLARPKFLKAVRELVHAADAEES